MSNIYFPAPCGYHVIITMLVINIMVYLIGEERPFEFVAFEKKFTISLSSTIDPFTNVLVERERGRERERYYIIAYFSSITCTPV